MKFISTSSQVSERMSSPEYEAFCISAFQLHIEQIQQGYGQVEEGEGGENDKYYLVFLRTVALRSSELSLLARRADRDYFRVLPLKPSHMYILWLLSYNVLSVVLYHWCRRMAISHSSQPFLNNSEEGALGRANGHAFILSGSSN